MADKTLIGWCDSTVNPVMGCDGCPLWPTPAALKRALAEALARVVRTGDAGRLAAGALDGLTATDIYQRREAIAHELAKEVIPRYGRGKGMRGALEATIERAFSCYAGHLHCNKSANALKPDKKVNKGYAPTFEQVTCFPGRMAKMAGKADLAGRSRPSREKTTRSGKVKTVPGKPWLDGLPRLVFVSDMGDALSSGVDFGYLKDEIIDAVRSPEGARHIWLWLTKRPARMAAFARWLEAEHGIAWPDNLVAMTSVIDQKMAGAADKLREVPAKVRGLSVEPLIEPVEITLEGIDWLIVGGESGKHARPFDLAWARGLRDRCRQEGVAFFGKQLGRRPVEDGRALKLRDGHGGDWSEWPADLRVREMPARFGALAGLEAATVQR